MMDWLVFSALQAQTFDHMRSVLLEVKQLKVSVLVWVPPEADLAARIRCSFWGEGWSQEGPGGQGDGGRDSKEMGCQMGQSCGRLALGPHPWGLWEMG